MGSSKVEQQLWAFPPIFCCKLMPVQPITFANSLDPDQDRRNVGPDLNPNRLTL